MRIVTLFVRPMRAEVIVSVGDAAAFVPFRSNGSSVVTETARTVMSLRECDVDTPCIL
jgi:hypothetical protein